MVIPGRGTKFVKIRSLLGFELRVPVDKTARPDEQVAVVWEQWKGRNGRGGYRVERTLYPQWRVGANLVARQHPGWGRVTETEPYKNACSEQY